MDDVEVVLLVLAVLELELGLGGEVAFPFKGALENGSKHLSQAGATALLFTRGLLLILSHAECA